MSSSSIQNDRWFVDVKGDIRGPITGWDIIAQLIDGQLKVTHRVSRDRTNWKAVCNEPYFETAVSELLESMSKEVLKFSAGPAGQTLDEKSGFHNLKDISSGINEQLKHANQLAEMSAGVNGLRKILTEMAAKKKLVIDVRETKKNEDEIHPDDRNEYIEAPSAKSRWLNLKDKAVLRKLIVLALLLCLLAGAAFKYQAFRQAEAEKAAAQIRLAVEAKRLGDYDKAIQIFDGVKVQSDLDAEALIAYSEAQAAKGQTVQAKGTLQTALKKANTKTERSDIYNLSAHIASQENDEPAAESYYEQSLKENPTFVAYHNLGVTALTRSEYPRAEELLLKAMAMPEPNKGATLLALFETALYLDQKEASTLRLTKMKDLLAKYQAVPQALGREALAAQVIVSDRLRDATAMREQILRFVDLDDTLLPKRVHGDLDERRTTWPYVFAWCRELYKNNSKNDAVSAFFAVCAWHFSGGPAGAVAYAQYAYQLNPHDPWVTGLLAYTLWSSGKTAEATNLLKAAAAPAIWGSRLASVTRAELCKSAEKPSFCLVTN